MNKLSPFAYISGIFSVYGALPLLFAHLQKLPIFGFVNMDFFKNNKTVVLIICISCITFWILYLLNRPIRKRMGARGLPCSIMRYLTYLYPRNYKKSIDWLHYNILHTKYKVVGQIVSHPHYTLNSPEVRTLIDELLREFYYTLRTLMRVDFSINIKLFESAEQNRTLIAYTYRRFPGENERKRKENRKIKRERCDDERFFIKKHSRRNLDKIHPDIDSYVADENDLKRCFAYDYAMSAEEHFWISNDLEKEKTKKNFISSSEKYNDYYNSMAVFLISAPLGKDANTQETAGLLQVDSLKKNVFISKESKAVIGFMAHILYEVIALLMIRTQQRLENKKG